MMRVLAWYSAGVLVYYVALQALMVVLTAGSAVALHRERRVHRFGRIRDMLDSDLAPPVSIVVAAYNEEAGIAEAIRSMSMVEYPRFEIIVANDGSTDDTLGRLLEEFDMVEIPYPMRISIETMPIRKVYRSRLPIPLTVVDKENGGRADALNVAIQAARYPYVMATDADVIIDGKALMHAMGRIAEDRNRIVAVGGNVRPINGCVVRYGHVVEAAMPRSLIERYQLLEYVRAFVASRPAWSLLNALPLLSGAFGVFRRDVAIDVGGFTPGHMGEDLDLTMRIHRWFRERREPYRIVYSPSAVVWTEVPTSRQVLRRQRIRWHRGLMRATSDFRSSFFNARHGALGLLSWPAFFVFEYLAPIVEATGYLVIPIALATGAIDPGIAAILFVVALLAGAATSILALVLDERFGHFNDPRETLQLLTVVFIENLGLRQLTVWWRVRALFGGRTTRQWGNMERQGVTHLTRKAS